MNIKFKLLKSNHLPSIITFKSFSIQPRLTLLRPFTPLLYSLYSLILGSLSFKIYNCTVQVYVWIWWYDLKYYSIMGFQCNALAKNININGFGLVMRMVNGWMGMWVAFPHHNSLPHVIYDQGTRQSLVYLFTTGIPNRSNWLTFIPFLFQQGKEFSSFFILP